MRNHFGILVVVFVTTVLMIGCQNGGGGNSTSSNPAPTVGEGPSAPGDGPTRGPDPKPDIIHQDIPGGSEIYFNVRTREAILKEPGTTGALELSFEYGIPNANLGYLAGYEGRTWTEKCRTYHSYMKTMINRYRAAVKAGSRIAETMADAKQSLEPGTLPIGLIKLDVDFRSRVDVEKTVRDAWSKELPSPSHVRTLTARDLTYDARSSTATPTALTLLDGQGLSGLERISEGPVRTNTNQYCDVLLDNVSVNLKADEFAIYFPVTIVEARGGVQPKPR